MIYCYVKLQCILETIKTEQNRSMGKNKDQKYKEGGNIRSRGTN